MCWGALVVCVSAPETASSANPPAGDATDRKTTAAALAVDVEKLVLANGLSVLLVPDPSSSSVLVDMTFRAGTVFEPPERSGLAHLTEHVLMRGPTPDTDYVRILEQRRAREVNAFTGADQMFFRTVLPPEELPIALWVAADRVATLPGLLDQVVIEKHRRVVLEERAERHVDLPFGLVDMAISAQLFPRPHPLHGMVIGTPDALARITGEDVRAFTARHITASNAILTIAGRFDPDVAKTWIRDTVARLPRGERPRYPELPKQRNEGGVIALEERLSRRPRVTILWRLDDLDPPTAGALELGALLLSSYVDGAFGTEVEAELGELGSQGFFRLDVTMPHEKPVESAAGEAEVFLRYLTAVDMPRDIYTATRLARDRATLFALDSLRGRAYLVTALEATFGEPRKASEYLGKHWSYERHDVQHTAWKNLITGPKRLVIHARPRKMRQAKLDWDERLEVE